MNHHQYLPNLCAMSLAIFFLFSIMVAIAKAYEDTIPPSSDDLWNTAPEFANSKDIYDKLKDGGWINEEVSFKDFDYILVLTQQLSNMYDNIEPELILAMIAQESRFVSTASNNGAHGLMQLIPVYQQKRMEQFVENDHIFSLDDFYDIRLNVVTGMDYMNYILEETEGDVAYALMWYNQGPTSASKDYLDKNYISEYARNIITLSNRLRPYLEEGRA